MSRALYTKYRPARFADVVGQDDVVTTLRNELKAGRIGHSYIFTGIRGTGKTTLARILAKAVNCLNPVDGEPCGKCEICTGIDSGAILDVTEIDGASNNGVDNIRDLRDESSYTPVAAKMRVYIIDEVHMLSIGAFNALLKIFEEPPAHVMFILATTEINKVPATILSRCQRFDLKRITNADISSQLVRIAENEGISIDYDAALAIARMSGGAMRDALSLLETCSSYSVSIDVETVKKLTGGVDRSYLEQLARFIAQHDVASVLTETSKLFAGSAEPRNLITELTSEFRNILMSKLGVLNLSNEFSDEEVNLFAGLSTFFTQKELLEIIDRLSAALSDMALSSDRRLTAELCIISICNGTAAVQSVSDNIPVSATEVKMTAPAYKPSKTKTNLQSAGISDDDAPPFEPTVVKSKQQLETEIPLPDLSEVPTESPKSDVRMMPEIGKPLDNWDKVVEALQSVNGLLYGFIRNSKAFFDGKYILIDGSDLLFKQLRNDSSAKEQLKAAIIEQTGIKAPIGPYRPESKTKKSGSDFSQIKQLAKDNDIPFEIKGEK